MAKRLEVPTSGDELRALMSDENKVAAWFSESAVRNGDTKRLMDAYATSFAQRNSDTDENIRMQVQSVVFDMMRDQRGGPKVGASLHNGKPTLTVDGTPALAKGKGGMYNKSSLGAKLEEHFKPEDRFSSIGEYCAAIFDKKTMSSRVGADKRVETLMKIFEFQNSFGSEEPGAGGFLIPEIMRSELLQLAIEESIVRSRATVIPMTTLRVPIPTVDDTSHATTIFGGIQFYWGEEGVALTESTATFGRIMLEARKFTGYFAVPQELLDDAPAFSGWFDAKVPQGLAFFEDVAFLTGSAADQPLGFINCDASVSVSAQTGQDAGTIVWENVTDMYARMLPQSLKNAVWICAIDTFPQLARMALSVGTGGGPVWIGGWSQPGSDMPPMTILGRPVIFTEKVPKLGTTGDINFVDLSYYLIGDRQQIRVDSSDQYLFKNNQVAYRIIERVDGRPWLRSALTPHNGSSNTLSPFVQLASR